MTEGGVLLIGLLYDQDIIPVSFDEEETGVLDVGFQYDQDILNISFMLGE